MNRNEHTNNRRFIRAALRQPTDTVPVWIMRQAGRYLPEYRAVRKRAGSFLSLCKTPELACEVTLQPVTRFPLDAAIIFSDILIVPEAVGMELHFKENHGPSFPQPLRSKKDITSLHAPDIGQLNYLMEAINMVQRELNGRVPLIGFAGSPWTLASYMVEGGGGSFRNIKRLMLDHPDLLLRLLDLLADAVADCLNAQIDAGVDCVMVFDSWGGVLNTTHYRNYSLAPLRKVAKRLTDKRPGEKDNEKVIPSILFTRGGGCWLEDMADSGYDVLGLDWLCDLGEARQRVGDRVALQGNLDPAALYAKPAALREEVRRIINSYGANAGHIFNLGHGIEPQTDPEQVAVLVDTVHEAGKAASG